MRPRARYALPQLAWPLVAATLVSAEPSPAALRRAIEPIVSRRELASASWGIEVRSLKSGRALYQLDEGRALRPASTLKLVTTAVALDLFGPAARIRTTLETAGRQDGLGRILGDVYLVGRGATMLTPPTSPGRPTAPLEELADALVAAGVRRIEGRLIGHEGAFSGDRRGHDWTWEDLVWGYGAEVSALSWNDGVVEARLQPGERVGDPALLDVAPLTPLVSIVSTVVTADAGTPDEVVLEKEPGTGRIRLSGRLPLGGGWSGRLAVEDPARYATTTFASVLQAKGIRVTGDVLTSRAPLPPALRVLAVHEGPALAELVRQVNKESLNVHAEALLRLVGLRARGEGSVENGIDAAFEILARLGVPTEGWVISDGSGLARSDLATPAGLATLLVAMDRHPHAAVFRESLPVAGVDGTLERRLHGAAQRRIVAKTDAGVPDRRRRRRPRADRSPDDRGRVGSRERSPARRRGGPALLLAARALWAGQELGGAGCFGSAGALQGPRHRPHEDAAVERVARPPRAQG
jgi:D-alanyl-D-alanine carboxypeptidase/D-alanyl-D-alanine-endopeptidase (penicillin-binding protein 4)